MGGNGVTGAASVRLLGLFLDHRRPQALLLRDVDGRGWQGKRAYIGASHIRAVFE